MTQRPIEIDRRRRRRNTDGACQVEPTGTPASYGADEPPKAQTRRFVHKGLPSRTAVGLADARAGSSVISLPLLKTGNNG